ncbi:MAG: GntR family transcriptional regulator [Propionibacteriales bacterium]|nr:GntR family transcriptional regulator [Propionibacteriales bacterium]
MATRRSSAAAGAQDAIKEYLLQEGLHPGDPMPTETVLCEQLGVSRSSVREAMRTLAALDIVEVRHGTGTFVGHLSLDPLVNGLAFRGMLSPGDDHVALREVVELRTALDQGIAEQVVAAIRGTVDDEMARLVAEMIDLSERGESFAEQDRAFHAALLAKLPNRLVAQLVEALWEVHTQVLPRLGVATPDDIAKTAAAHGDMLTAAQAGDLPSYRAAVNAHYAPLLRVLARESANTD